MNIPKLNIKSRLLLMMLLLSTVVCVVLFLIADYSTQSALRQRVLDQLTSVRDSRATQIETYFENMRAHVASLSQDPTVVSASKEFVNSLEQPDQTSQLDTTNKMGGKFALTSVQSKRLAEFYQDSFFDTIRNRGDGDPVLSNYLPQSPSGRYLQFHYLHPFRESLKSRQDSERESNLELRRIDDGGGGGLADDTQSSPLSGDDELPDPTYDQTHEHYDLPLRRMQRVFSYHDLYIIDVKNLDVVYTAEKDVDFGTNLHSGPYSSSSLASAVRRAAESPNKDFVAVEDFQFYIPSEGRPAAFMAAPIYDESEKIGVIAVQFSIEKIDQIMTSGKQWELSGLGKTGETFLVGQDGTMRSNSRRLLENEPGFVDSLAETQLPKSTIEQIERLHTSILLQPVENEAVERASDGKTGVSFVEQISGIDAIAAYRPLQLPGLRWMLISEMWVEEAFGPLKNLRRYMVLSSAALLLVTTLLAMLLAASVTRPIDKFVDDSRDVVSGESEWLNVRAGDEFGVLAYELNKLIGGLRGNTEMEQQQRVASEELLARLMPERIIKSLQGGEDRIVDAHTNVSVLTARLVGFDSDVAVNSDTAAIQSHVESIDRLVTLLDNATEDHRIEKIKADGPLYIVTCGVAVPRLDHARRVVEFGRDIQNKVRAFNQQNATEVRVHIGIASGPIVSGVVGSRNMIYDIWGSPVQRSEQLAMQCPAGAIALGSLAHRSLGDMVETEIIMVGEDEIAIIPADASSSVSAAGERTPDRPFVSTTSKPVGGGQQSPRDGNVSAATTSGRGGASGDLSSASGGESGRKSPRRTR